MVRVRVRVRAGLRVGYSIISVRIAAIFCRFGAFA